MTEIGQLGNGCICFLVKSKIKKITRYHSITHISKSFLQKQNRTKQKNNENAGRLWNIVSKHATYFANESKLIAHCIAHQLCTMKSESFKVFCKKGSKCTIEREYEYEERCMRYMRDMNLSAVRDALSTALREVYRNYFLGPRNFEQHYPNWPLGKTEKGQRDRE